MLNFIASRTAHLTSLNVQFLTPFVGSPYLVLLGVRLTVLGHNLEVRKLRRTERPATNSKNLNSLNRLPSTTTEEHLKLWKIQLSSLENSEFSKLLWESQFSSILEYPSYLGTKSTMQRLSENIFFSKGVLKRIIKITNPWRVQLSRWVLVN